MATRLLVFTMIVGLLVVKVTVGMGGEGYEQGKYSTTKLTVLSKIQPFFLSNCWSGCCKPVINLKSSEKVDFASFFCHCSHWFYGGVAFCRSLLRILTDIIPLGTIITNPVMNIWLTYLEF